MDSIKHINWLVAVTPIDKPGDVKQRTTSIATPLISFSRDRVNVVGTDKNHYQSYHLC